MKKSSMPHRILLGEKEIPTSWYNIMADMPEPVDPPLNPRTREVAKPEDLAPIFPAELVRQEMTQDRYIEIPEEVREVYKLYRPSPLHRAFRLEAALDTPAKIFYKNESVSMAGSHKTNTAIPQAYFNKKEGVKRITTETGAGQWGCAMALACTYFDIELDVYMVKVSFTQKPYRRSMMELWGANVFASPTDRTEAGRKILAKDPESTGSLGIAISEAVELAAQRDDTKYALGSVLNHVGLHQTIIGQEAKKQLELVDEYPDIVIGCVGGGSNFAGISFPFAKDKFEGKNVELIAVEPSSCPTLTKGSYEYDYGDEAGLTPLMKMYTLHHDFVPSAIHAGGLRYHGASPILSKLVHDGYVKPVSFAQTEVFDSAMLFARTEGMIIAPESSHALKAAIVEALKCKESGEAKTILFNLSGHGLLDMTGYEAFLDDKLKD